MPIASLLTIPDDARTGSGSHFIQMAGSTTIRSTGIA
jgi:hypothetical protein